MRDPQCLVCRRRATLALVLISVLLPGFLPTGLSAGGGDPVDSGPGGIVAPRDSVGPLEQPTAISAIDTLNARLRAIEVVLQKSWWENHAGVLAILGTVIGLAGALGAVALTSALQGRSRARAAKAILDTLVREAIGDLDRLCYITELHSIGSRSKGSIPQAGRRHLMGQYATLATDSAPLVCLTRLYNDFDRIMAYHDRAVESDASAKPGVASYATGVTAAFVRSSIGVVLQTLEELCRHSESRVSLPEGVRKRVELIARFRDDPSALSVIGTIVVKTRQGDPSSLSVMQHLKTMQENGSLNPDEDLIRLLRRLADKHIGLDDHKYVLQPEMQNATSASWLA